MAQAVNKNTFSSTYKDDYTDSDGYYRILFNSGKKLQARELTQMQTIVQKQIERMGNNIFKDNSVIKKAATQVDNSYQFIRLNTTNEQVSTPQDLVGAVYTGVTSQISFRVDKVVEAGLNPVTDPLTLYGTYTSTENFTGGSNAQIVAQPNEVMTASGKPNIRVENATASTGFGSRFLATEGIYYSKGFFIFTEKQELIISKYTNNPTTVVGFKRVDEVVTVSDDTALYDNQGSSPNLTAPGADRYRIKLELVEEKNISPTDTFIRKAVIENGSIISSAPLGNEYNKPREFVAQRIKENSGDYLVKPFNLKYSADSQDTHLLATVSDGIAVVDGYRATSYTSSPTIRLDKSTSVISLEDQLVPVTFGSYFEIDSVPAQIPDLTKAVGLEKQTIKDGADFGDGAVGTIGTCYIRFIEENNPSGYRVYVTDLELISGSAISDIGSIGTNASQYVNINQNSRENGPFNNTGTLNSLIFPLPNKRPSDIDNADLTVQRILKFTPSSSTKSVDVDNSNEAWVNKDDWLITKSDGQIAGATITLANSNQRADFAGLTSGQETRVVAFVRKTNVTARSKTKTYVNTVKKVITDPVTNQQYIDLNKADIIDVVDITLPGLPGTGDSNQSYLTNFTLDNGRRDNFYLNGRLLLSGALPPGSTTNGLRVTYNHFQHDANNTFFDKTSYDGEVSYGEIPNHRYANGEQINLRDALDFRPTVDSDGDFEIANGGSFNELPQPNNVVDINVDYFLPRVDKVVIDTNGQVQYLAGAPSWTPMAPETPKSTIELFRIRMGANTIDPKDVDIHRVDRKRYTMDQINLLEKRLGRLEETVSLSLLENKVADFSVLDNTGNVRLKTAFVVDNFTSHELTDVNNANLRSAINIQSGLLYPRKSENSVELLYDSDVNNPIGEANVCIKGGFIIPVYSEELYMENEFASNSQLVNPFQVNNYSGTIQLSPSSDTWYETAFPYDKVVNYRGSTIKSNGAYQWGDWEWNWVGKELEQLQVGDQTNQQVTTSGRTTTTSWNVVENIYVQENYVEDRLIKTEAIPKCRSKKIRFRATGLRPNAKHYAFFDDVSVDDYVKTETFSSTWMNDFNGDSSYGGEFNSITSHPNGSEQLKSNSEGIIEGSFFLPATNTLSFNTGTLKFELRDVTGVNNENYLSRGVTNFVSNGTLKLYQEIWTSTRYIEIEGDQSVYTKPAVVSNSSGGGDDGNDWFTPTVTTFSDNSCTVDDGWGGGWSNSGGFVAEDNTDYGGSLGQDNGWNITW